MGANSQVGETAGKVWHGPSGAGPQTRAKVKNPLAEAIAERAWSPEARRYLVRVAIVFAAQFAAAKIGDVLQSINSGGIGPVWPASGIALAALLLWDYSVWPGVAAASFLLALSSPLPYWAAIAYAGGTTLAAVVGAFLLRRGRFEKSLSRLRDALELILLGALGSSMVSASIGTSLLYGTHLRGWSGFGSAWLIYWLGDSTSVLVITPLVLVLPALFRIRNRNRLAELALLLLLLGATTLVIFGDLTPVPIGLHALAFAVLPFVMWAAIRFGVGASTLSIFLVATIAAVETSLASGPFTTNSPFVNAVLLDFFFGVLSVTGLTLAALYAEKEHAHREREWFISQQAAMEARLEGAKALKASEERWGLAAKAGRMYAYEWDVATDEIVRSGDVASAVEPNGPVLGRTRKQLLTCVHPDDRALFKASARERTPENPDIQIRYRRLCPDASVAWVEETARAFFDERGIMTRMIGMVTDVTERKLAEEARFRHAAIVESSEDAIISGTLDGIIVSWNAGAEKLYGYTEADAVGRSISILVPPELPNDEDKIRETMKSGTRIEHFETVRVTKAGRKVNVSLTISPIKDSSGGTVGISGIARDITQRKQAEEALARRGRELIEAQEQERRRIARDLHDDVAQRLALLAIELDQLQQGLPDYELRRRVAGIGEQAAQISTDVQTMSHELHSSKLEYLGIVAATKGFCREFGEQQKVKIDFTSQDIPPCLSPEISVCLFRVLQEGLRNAVKHSGVSRLQLQLREDSGEIHLVIRDSGRGFDVQAALQGKGLGLTSMRERVRLVNGTIAIESEPAAGTTIHVRVPLGSENLSERAAS